MAILRKSAIGLAVLAIAAVTFAVPASAAGPAPCSRMTLMNRSGHDIHVPTVKDSTSCQMGRDYAVADEKVVAQFQTGLKVCYPNLRMASPYSNESVKDLRADGSFGPRTEAALKAVQRHIGTAADGIYGPNTRDRMKFTTPDRVYCYGY